MLPSEYQLSQLQFHQVSFKNAAALMVQASRLFLNTNSVPLRNATRKQSFILQLILIHTAVVVKCFECTYVVCKTID